MLTFKQYLQEGVKQGFEGMGQGVDLNHHIKFKRSFPATRNLNMIDYTLAKPKSVNDLVSGAYFNINNLHEDVLKKIAVLHQKGHKGLDFYLMGDKLIIADPKKFYPVKDFKNGKVFKEWGITTGWLNERIAGYVDYIGLAGDEDDDY